MCADYLQLCTIYIDTYYYRRLAAVCRDDHDDDDDDDDDDCECSTAMHLQIREEGTVG